MLEKLCLLVRGICGAVRLMKAPTTDNNTGNVSQESPQRHSLYDRGSPTDKEKYLQERGYVTQQAFWGYHDTIAA